MCSHLYSQTGMFLSLSRPTRTHPQCLINIAQSIFFWPEICVVDAVTDAMKYYIHLYTTDDDNNNKMDNYRLCDIRIILMPPLSFSTFPWPWTLFPIRFLSHLTPSCQTFCPVAWSPLRIRYYHQTEQRLSFMECRPSREWNDGASWSRWLQWSHKE